MKARQMAEKLGYENKKSSQIVAVIISIIIFWIIITPYQASVN